MILKNRIACRICLSTNVKFYHFEAFQLKSYYEEITNEVLTKEDKLLHFFCYQCSAMLQKYHSFRELCLKSQKSLKHIFTQNLDIPFEVILKWEQNNNKICPLISKFNKNSNLGYFKYKESDKKGDQSQDDPLAIDSILYEESSNTDFGDEENLESNEVVELNSDSNNDAGENDFEEFANQDSNNVGKSSISNDKHNYFPHNRVGNDDTNEDNAHNLDTTKWKVVILSKEEATKQFHEKIREQNIKCLEKNICKHCQRSFRYNKMLIKHMSCHSEDNGKYECFLCKKRYLTNRHLKRHVNDHLVKYHCLQCTQVFSNIGSALRHEEYHTGVEYTCKFCAAKFKKKITYYSHMRIIHRSSHLCPYCGASFLSDFGVQLHIGRAHKTSNVNKDTGDLATYCEKCDIVFENTEAFKAHGRNSDKHITEDDLLSDDSGQRILRRLKGHRYVKMCEQCGKTYYSKLQYNDHMHLAHGIPRPRYNKNPSTVCEICGATIALHGLPLHMFTHEGKRFTCPECGKDFSNPANMKRHFQLHKNPKPFTCELCDKNFSTKVGVKLHVRTVHLKEPHPPRKCTRIKFRTLSGKINDEL